MRWNFFYVWKGDLQIPTPPPFSRIPGLVTKTSVKSGYLSLYSPDIHHCSAEYPHLDFSLFLFISKKREKTIIFSCILVRFKKGGGTQKWKWTSPEGTELLWKRKDSKIKKHEKHMFQKLTSLLFFHFLLAACLLRYFIIYRFQNVDCFQGFKLFVQP